MHQIIVIVIISLALSFMYLYVNTGTFFSENKAEPVEVFFSTSQGKQLGELGNGMTGVTEKYGGLKSIEFTINDPFKDTQDGSSRFQIRFNNFTNEIKFWYPTGNDNEEKYNESAVNGYVLTHVPDYQISASFINGEILPIWSQVWQAQPDMPVSTNAFLHQTSFGVWKGEYFFSSGFAGITSEYNGHEETYLQVADEKMTFNILIPKGFHVENPERYNLSAESGGTLVSQTISSGNSFYLEVRDGGAQNVAAAVNFVIPMAVGILLTLVSEELWEKTKPRTKSR